MDIVSELELNRSKRCRILINIGTVSNRSQRMQTVASSPGPSSFITKLTCYTLSNGRGLQRIRVRYGLKERFSISTT